MNFFTLMHIKIEEMQRLKENIKLNRNKTDRAIHLYYCCSFILFSIE